MVKLMVRFPNQRVLKKNTKTISFTNLEFTNSKLLVWNHSSLEENALDIWNHTETMKLRLFNKFYNSRTIFNPLKVKSCIR